MRTRIGRWGSSLAVRLPTAYANALTRKEGTQLEVSMVEGGLLLRTGRPEFTLEAFVAQITPENRHGETDWGEPLGREAW